MAMEEESSWIAAMAREELLQLEAQHPHRFRSLKLELRALIAESSSCDCNSVSPDAAAPTQVSSNRKRKDGGARSAAGGAKRKKNGGWDLDSADEVLERARGCLMRIQQVKNSFFR